MTATTDATSRAMNALLCPDCGRFKARDVDDAAAGLCPKWWAVRDPQADADCVEQQKYRDVRMAALGRYAAPTGLRCEACGTSVGVPCEKNGYDNGCIQCESCKRHVCEDCQCGEEPGLCGDCAERRGMEEAIERLESEKTTLSGDQFKAGWNEAVRVLDPEGAHRAAIANAEAARQYEALQEAASKCVRAWDDKVGSADFKSRMRPLLADLARAAALDPTGKPSAAHEEEG